MSEKWCEHIQWGIVEVKKGRSEYGWFYNNTRSEQVYVWKFCPICGAPRPEPRKKLWEKVKEEHLRQFHMGPKTKGNGWEQIAQVAIDHAIEILRESKDYSMGYINLDCFEKRLRDSL